MSITEGIGLGGDEEEGDDRVENRTVGGKGNGDGVCYI